MKSQYSTRRRVDRTARVTGDSIAKHPWPVVTKSALSDFLHRRSIDTRPGNAQIEALIETKMAMRDALLRLRRTATLACVQDDVKKRLIEVANELEVTIERFPLSVV